jgi:hypothetical protein
VLSVCGLHSAERQDDLRMMKNLQGGSYGLTEEIFRQLPGGTEENHDQV